MTARPKTKAPELLAPVSRTFVALRDAGYITESELNGIGNGRNNQRMLDKIPRTGQEDCNEIVRRIGSVIDELMKTMDDEDIDAPELPADIPPIVEKIDQWYMQRDMETSPCAYCPAYGKGAKCPEGIPTAELGVDAYVNDCDWFNHHVDNTDVPVVFPR